jgi:hypothetical protein
MCRSWFSSHNLCRANGFSKQSAIAWLKFHVAWCERWIIKIKEDKTQAIYFSHQTRLPDSLLALNGWNILFVNSVKYLGVIFDKRMPSEHSLDYISYSKVSD